MKKEEVVVKFTAKDALKILKLLENYKQKECISYTIPLLVEDKSPFKKLYLFYSIERKIWLASATKIQDRILIKPKQLKELLNSESLYSSKHQNDKLIGVKGGIGNKGLEYKPKILEDGRWYKCPSLLTDEFIFMFTGEFGNGKVIGFNSSGEYCYDLDIHEEQVPYCIEIKLEEVVKAFIYHMENFANKK